jgi:CheY-like chemotaxis protein
MHAPKMASVVGECALSIPEPGGLEARARSVREQRCAGTRETPRRGHEPDSRRIVADTQGMAEPCPTSGSVRDGQPLRVLVVDAYTDAADSLALLLRLWGHEVRIARTGPQALEIAWSWLPAVALVEVVLPELDGYALARRLRGHGVVLVAVSGQASQRHRRRCAREGFALALVKPVDPDELRRVLAQLAEGRTGDMGPGRV